MLTWLYFTDIYIIFISAYDETQQHKDMRFSLILSTMITNLIIITNEIITIIAVKAKVKIIAI